MEGIHGVDTSWLHHRRGQRSASAGARTSDEQPAHDLPAISIDSNKDLDLSEKSITASTADGASDASNPHPKPTSDAHPNTHGLHLPYIGQKHHENVKPQLAKPMSPSATAATGAPSPRGGKESGRLSPGLSRKSSWISSLSSKFSSKSQEPKEPSQQSPRAATTAASTADKASPGSKSDKPDAGASGNAKDTKGEVPLQPAPPKPSGFLSSAFRRLSSSSGATASKTIPNGGICPRMVLNIDPHRDRCDISDMQPAKLRRVAFCVDVEIAPTPAYREPSPEDPTLTAQQRKRSNSGSEKKSKVKSKDRSEGEALKHPNAMAQIKDKSAAKPDEGSSGAVETSATEKDTPTANDMAKAAPQQPPPSKLQPSKTAPKSNSLKSTPLHHDFGPNGMFEVDDFEEIPDQKPKPKARRGSTGGSPHHDFGRHGMFEIPSDSDDESKEAGESAGLKKTDSDMSALSPPAHDSLPGHVYTQHLMFEIPDEEHEQEDGSGSASSDTDDKSKEPVMYEHPAEKLPTANGTQQANPAVKEGEEEKEPQGSDNKTTDKPAEETADKPAENEAPAVSRKKEKKKKYEEERKERKEKKRQAAIAYGRIPVELTRDNTSSSAGPQQPAAKPKVQNRPTTDPLRVYRRCCSLRETQPLPRVVEQLSSSSICDPLNPAIVLVLDLSGQTIQMNDLVTLADWLGVVPVQKLILDGCGLTDETVRVVLSALLAVKTTEQTRHNKHLAKKTDKYKDRKERAGVIAKLSLKDNKLIGRQGWMHIGYFVNMSKSLKAIDLSLIPFPKKPPPPPPRTSSPPSTATGNPPGSRDGPLPIVEEATDEPFDLFCKCLSERKGGQLEEIVMSECDLYGDRVDKLVDAIIACKCHRFGFAHNDLDSQGMKAMARYIRSGHCIGIDLGGHDFSNPEYQKIIVNALDFPDNGMWAISLANTNISPSDLKKFLSVLAKLKSFRLFDLSHNHKLFESTPNALPVLGRYLPKMAELKRFHLNDTSMRSEHAIALAEICPEIPTIAHISILENPALTELANAVDEAAQEEACALYASLMAATRVSSTIVCIDIDVPSKNNSEVVKALAKQVVAYSLRNMERNEAFKSAAAFITEPHGGEEAVAVPDILLHIVGHLDQPDDASDDEPPAPDEDYLVGGTGVVKALSIVLGNRSSRDSRRMSRDLTPQQSGTNTPKVGDAAFSKGEAKDVSKSLLTSARKIRHRLQPALVRARVDGENSDNYRRLFYLDTTLERMIQRFEEEYPECKLPRPRSTHVDLTVTSSPDPLHAQTHSSSLANALQAADESKEVAVGSEDEGETLASSLRRSRHGSDVSLASRNLMNEEGRLHRFGQRMRRELEPVEPQHVDALRARLDKMDGETIKQEVENKGVDRVLEEVGANIEELRELEKQGGGVWEKCKNAGMYYPANTEKASDEPSEELSEKSRREQLEQWEKISRMDSAIAGDDEDDSGLEITH